MAETSEESTFNSIHKNIRKSKYLTNVQKKRLTKIFGSRFIAAYKAVENGNVRKYIFNPSRRKVWIVTGKERDYYILPLANFCSCFDFYFRVIDYEVSFCYHLIAQKIAESLGWYDRIDVEDDMYDVLMKEWRKVTL